jgi:hypothetical protein
MIEADPVAATQAFGAAIRNVEVERRPLAASEAASSGGCWLELSAPEEESRLETRRAGVVGGLVARYRPSLFAREAAWVRQPDIFIV